MEDKKHTVTAFTVRRMALSDAEKVAELERLCFSLPWSKRLVEESVSSPFDTGFVLEQGGEILAYGILSIVAGEGEIQRIAVLPEKRRRGLASKVMEAMKDYAIEQKAESILLEVRQSNEAARNLYKAWGFCEEGIRKGYYSDPKEDAILMGLRGL